MLFRQVLHEDLGCASYLLGDRGVAAVVDPQWDVDPYLHLARLHGVRIEHVLETHNHADHVSGHGRLAAATGAIVHVHEEAAVSYPHEEFADGWRLELGEVVLEAIHTPGHRPEHTSFLVRDDSGEPWALLGGDSLFCGDVARPDLAVEKAEGAREIFRSLHERVLVLGDDVELWPGHLGGSMCGSAAIDNKSSSTIGYERRHNPALRTTDKEEFVRGTLASLGEQPPHTAHVVALNRGPFREEVSAPVPLSPRGIESAVAAGAVVVDARTNEQFDEAHISGALSASAYDTGFATKVARVVEPDAEIVVVAASDGYEMEAAELIGAVGLRVHGFLEGGMTAWRSEGKPVARIELIGVETLAERLEGADPPTVLDVRDADEYADGHIPGSLHIPFGELADRLGELPPGRPVAAVCSGGKRSGLAASILQREGVEQVVHVGHGGVGTWERQGRPLG